jgi:hypothetical protein
MFPYGVVIMKLNKNRRYALIIGLCPPIYYAWRDGIAVLLAPECIVWYVVGAAVWWFGSYKSGEK